MSTKHLRLVAPLALVILAACSPRAQTANTAQEFMDTKHPGVAGAIENAVGASTGNPETDAALGAVDIIKNIEKFDEAKSEAVAAAMKDDAATAEAKLKEAQKFRPVWDQTIGFLGIALQCGTNAASQRMDALENQIAATKDTYQAQKTIYIATYQANVVMTALGRMQLTPRERDRRRAKVADVLSRLYARNASLSSGPAADSDLESAARYRQMQKELEAGIGGAY